MWEMKKIPWVMKKIPWLMKKIFPLHQKQTKIPLLILQSKKSLEVYIDKWLSVLWKYGIIQMS